MHNAVSIGSIGSIGACGLAVLLSATPASAKDSKRVCTPAYVAYKSAVEQVKVGHVHEANELLQTCIESTCGGLIPKCRALHDKLVSQMPTVVPVVTDETGAPRVDVQVKVDGQLLTSKLDGIGLPVEAGVHEFTFATDGGVCAAQKVMVVEGQRNRLITVSMHPAEQSTQKPAAASEAVPVEATASSAKGPSYAPLHEEAGVEAPSHDSTTRESTNGGRWAPPRSAFPYILGGVGLAGVGAGALLTFWGNKDNSDLQAQCNPSCKQSSVDHIRTMYVAADISLGAGAAALAVTTWLFASSRASEKPSKAATVVEVHPTSSGAFASVSGAF
jgi:hypothetical protein